MNYATARGYFSRHILSVYDIWKHYQNSVFNGKIPFK